MNDLVAGQLQKMNLSKGVVLDGYPTTKDQADHLGALVKKLGLPDPIIIQLDVPDNIDRSGSKTESARTTRPSRSRGA